MELDNDERRALLALWCQVAWADGNIVEAERRRVYALLERLGADSVSRAELDEWLKTGPPAVTESLSTQARELFLHEAVGIVSADLDVAPEEVATVRDILERYFRKVEDLVIG